MRRGAPSRRRWPTSPAAASVSVDMVANSKQGNRAVIKVDNSAGIARGEIEGRIQERMKYYATPYEISWAASFRH